MLTRLNSLPRSLALTISTHFLLELQPWSPELIVDIDSNGAVAAAAQAEIDRPIQSITSRPSLLPMPDPSTATSALERHRRRSTTPEDTNSSAMEKKDGARAPSSHTSTSCPETSTSGPYLRASNRRTDELHFSLSLVLSFTHNRSPPEPHSSWNLPMVARKSSASGRQHLRS